MTLTIFYSCSPCGIVKRPLEVQARENGQDIVDWTQLVSLAITRDHKRVSPDCVATYITEVYVPVSGANVIGGPSIH